MFGMESVRQGLRQRPDDADAHTVRDAVHAGPVCQEVVLKTLVAWQWFRDARMAPCPWDACRRDALVVCVVWSFVNTRDTCLDGFQEYALAVHW